MMMCGTVCTGTRYTLARGGRYTSKRKLQHSSTSDKQQVSNVKTKNPLFIFSYIIQ